jgi:ferredoxin-NADP reductase
VTPGSSNATGETEQTRPRGPGAWQVADLVEKSRETTTASTLVFDVGDWPGHRAGQHVDVRLTAEDGYQTQRSYSIASSPEDGRIALTVERLEDGEVSPYLVDEMQVGDVLELRGPIGGWFVWDTRDGGPLVLVGGGSGLVPLMAMVRHRAAVGSRVPTRLLLSARRADDVLYATELQATAAAGDGLGLFTTLTREAPPGWRGFTRRVDAEMLAEVAFAPAEMARVFVCGPTSFVETVAAALIELGHDPAMVKTERFGPTGGAQT